MLSVACTICQANYWLAFFNLSQYNYESKQDISGKKQTIKKNYCELIVLQEIACKEENPAKEMRVFYFFFFYY